MEWRGKGFFVAARILTGDDVLFRTQQVGDADLFYMWIVTFEVIAESEGHDGQSGVVDGAGFAILALVDLALFVLELTLGSMNVAHASVPAC